VNVCSDETDVTQSAQRSRRSQKRETQGASRAGRGGALLTREIMEQGRVTLADRLGRRSLQEREVGGAEESGQDSIKFKIGSKLVFADAAGGDVCLEIIFAADGETGNAAKNGELAGVIEDVGERALEKFFGRGMKRIRAGEKVIEALERVEEALDFVGPGEGRRVVPGGLPFGHGECPLEQVADVGENLGGGAAIVSCLEIDIALRGITNDFAGAIGDGG
jgi:hypothetical protein